jgi:hypothetical protein
LILRQERKIKKPGYPLQFLKNASGVFCGISASIQAAWASSKSEGLATSPLRAQGLQGL